MNLIDVYWILILTFSVAIIGGLGLFYRKADD